MVAIKPALCYGICTKKDHGYNFHAFIGAEVFRKEKNISFSEYNYISHEDSNINYLRSVAKRGNNPIFCLTSEYRHSLTIVANEFPETNFVILNTIVNLPNVKSVVFASHEGTFLAGMAAGVLTKTNVIGISLLDFHFIHRDVWGFIQGVEHVNKHARCIKNTIGGEVTDFCNVEACFVAAREQIAQSADILFAPLSQTGYGALQAAKDVGKLYVGSHTNQNSLYPGGVLTSFICRIDKVVYDILLESAVGKWKSGVRCLRMKDGVFDWALDRFNCDLIPNSLSAMINKAKSDIACGAVTVSDLSLSL